MRDLKLGETVFKVKPITEKIRKWFLDLVIADAKDLDHPVARLIANKLQGVEGPDREYSLKALMSVKGWDNPPQELIDKILRTPAAVRTLARNVIVPDPGFELVETLITEDNSAEVYSLLCEAIAPPTKEEIIQRNRLIRDRVIKKETEVCPDQPS